MKCSRTSVLAVCVFVWMALLCNVAWASDDDFGISFSPSIEKTIVDSLSVSVDGEVRSHNLSKDLERLGIGAYLGYKPIPYFKAEVGYTFIDQFRKETNVDGVHTESHWAPKHEVEVSVFGILPLGVLELSIRERYEYTYHQEVEAGRKMDADDSFRPEVVKQSKFEQVLRSRIQISAKIPNSPFSPYGSLDFYNDLLDGGRLYNYRVIFGCDYKLPVAGKVGLYVRSDISLTKADSYLLGIKYRYAF